MHKMAEMTHQLEFIDQYGIPVSIFGFLESDEDVIAISSDDRLVKLVDGARYRVGSGYGCGGTTSSAQWVLEEIKQLPTGSFKFASSLLSTIKYEKERRIKNKLAWKRWYKNVQGVGFWLFDEEESDDFYIKEALNVGIEQYIQKYQ
jgi:hypothetical protein